MRISQSFLDQLSAQAKANPRLRQAYDLRSSEDDNSQRMLNAMEPGTVMPIHRHRKSSRYVSENSRHGMWGKGALKTISEQLQKEIPGLTGFGETSLKDMRTFYEEWSSVVNRQPIADEIEPINESRLLTEIRQPVADELSWAEFMQVPFTHHIIILRKIKDLDERTFYIHQCATRAWSKYALRDFIRQDLYETPEVRNESMLNRTRTLR